MPESMREIPAGVGLGWRPQLAPLVIKHPALVDFIEVPLHLYSVEEYQQQDDPGWKVLSKAAELVPFISHGPCLSIGTAESPEGQALDNVQKLIQHFPIRSYSEHLCYMGIGGKQTNAFISLPFNDMAVETAVKNIRYVQQKLGVPFLLENITQHFTFSHGSMTEMEFISRVVEEADCGILLDVANVFINARNHGYDPYEFIDGLPAERIMQSHYCGASYVPYENYFYDSHSQPTSTPIWELLEYALNKTNLNTLIYERDSRLFYQDEVMSDIWQARELYLKYRKKPEKLKPARKPEIKDVQIKLEYNSEFRRFQEAFLSLLMSPVLSARYDKYGDSVLEKYQLDKESLATIASVHPAQRERLASYIQSKPVQPELKEMDEDKIPDAYQR